MVDDVRGHSLGYSVSLVMCLVAVLIVLGWRDIYRFYWSRRGGDARLVTQGIYRYIRHPQYTGFPMVTFGMLCDRALGMARFPKQLAPDSLPFVTPAKAGVQDTTVRRRPWMPAFAGMTTDCARDLRPTA